MTALEWLDAPLKLVFGVLATVTVLVWAFPVEALLAGGRDVATKLFAILPPVLYIIWQLREALKHRAINDDKFRQRRQAKPLSRWMAGFCKKRYPVPMNGRALTPAEICLWASAIFINAHLLLVPLLIVYGTKLDIGRTPRDFFALLCTTMGFACMVDFGLLMLPACRDGFFLRLLGIPYEKGLRFHKALGWVGIWFASLHGFGYWAVWLFGYSPGGWKFMEEQFPIHRHHFPIPSHIYGHHGRPSPHPDGPPLPAWINMQGVYNFCGLLSLLCMLGIAFTSLEVVRRHRWGVFKNTHYLFLPALLLGVCHMPVQMWIWLPGLVVYAAERTASWLRGHTDIVKVRISAPVAADTNAASGTAKDGSTVVRVDVPVGQLSPHTSSGSHWVYINFPEMGALEWHPFSIASSPAQASGQGYLTLYIRELGDWSSNLGKYLAEKKQKAIEDGTDVLVPARVDGVYGLISEDLWKYPSLVLVAGGLGVTPMISRLTEIVAQWKKAQRPTKGDEESVTPSEHDQLPSELQSLQRIRFVWAVRQLTDVEVFRRVLEEAMEVLPSGLFDLQIYWTRPKENAPPPSHIPDDKTESKLGETLASESAKCSSYNPTSIKAIAANQLTRGFCATLVAVLTAVLGLIAAVGSDKLDHYVCAARWRLMEEGMGPWLNDVDNNCRWYPYVIQFVLVLVAGVVSTLITFGLAFIWNIPKRRRAGNWVTLTETDPSPPSVGAAAAQQQQQQPQASSNLSDRSAHGAASSTRSGATPTPTRIEDCIHKGRPPLPDILAATVTEQMARDVQNTGSLKKVKCLVCGPMSLVEGVKDACAATETFRQLITYENEEFEL